MNHEVNFGCILYVSAKASSITDFLISFYCIFNSGHTVKSYAFTDTKCNIDLQIQIFDDL